MFSTKQLVFKELSNTQSLDGYVSGEILAKKCGVSRAAIWKAIQSLIKDGLDIEAVTNKGYHLKGQGAVLSEDVLNANEKGIKFKVFESLDSTMEEAKRLCAKCSVFRDKDNNLTEVSKDLHKLVILAEEQTSGKGRLGRKFYSPKQNGLYFSLVYIPKNSVVNPAKITATAAVAVCKVLNVLYGVDAKIKWVNDIFLGNKKVCGILTEGITNFETGKIEVVIVGIGINICEEKDGLPNELKGIATSVLGSENISCLKNELALKIAEELVDLYDAFEFDSEKSKQIMSDYKNYSFLLGKKLEITSVIGSQEHYTATALDILDDASLLVKLEDGSTKKLQSGEVSLKSSQFSNKADTFFK